MNSAWIKRSSCLRNVEKALADRGQGQFLSQSQIATAGSSLGVRRGLASGLPFAPLCIMNVSLLTFELFIFLWIFQMVTFLQF